MSESYKNKGFNEYFQVRALALMVRDSGFVRDHFDVINPSYFDDPLDATICRVVLQYHLKYGRAPSAEEAVVLVGDYVARNRVSLDTHKSLVDKLTQSYTLDLLDIDFVKDKMIEFARFQSLKSGVLSCIDLLGKADADSMPRIADEMQRTLEKAARVGEVSTRNLGVNLVDVLPNIRDFMLQDSRYDPTKVVPTGWPTIDRSRRGGLGAGELGVIMGPTKRGKSIALVNLSAIGTLLGKVVYYYTYELHEADVILRHAIRLTGVPERLIMAENPDPQYMERMRNLVQTEKKLFVKYEKPNSVGVSWIRSHLTRSCSLYDHRPGLIIVDYADKLLSKYTDSTYMAGGDVYTGLIGIANDFDCPVWTASQVGRGSWSNELIDMNSAADSVRKMTDADLVITLNQTREEKANQKMRLYVAGGRRGRDGLFCEANINYDLMLIEEANIPGYVAD